MHDPDAPKGDYTHWVLWDMPGESNGLPRGVTLHSVGVAGKNSFEKLGYGGPCPPPGHGPHHYHFRLYALDIPSLDMPEGSSRAAVEAAMRGHILEQATLTGIYERE
jgi:Raf kinase inhibitor-like YbhB/YbcL family protein